MPEVRACGQEVHMDKIIRLQQAMPSDMEAAILQDAANRFFLTGMKSSAGTVLVTRNKAWLIIDFRYFEEAEEKVKNCRVIEEKNLYSQIKQLLEAEGISALSLHTGLVTLEKYRQLETALKGISLDVSDSLSGLMDSLRREKDEFIHTVNSGCFFQTLGKSYIKGTHEKHSVSRCNTRQNQSDISI